MSYNAVTLRDKLDYEGGVEGGLDYGITDEDIEDADLSDIWYQMSELWEEFQDLRRSFNAVLDEKADSLDRLEEGD